jgi:tetratricopeptide (TPR) repeat protein
MERAQHIAIPSFADNARLNLGLVMLRLHRPDEALSLLSTAVRSFEARGEGRVASAGRIYLAMTRLELGALEQAEAEARAALLACANLPSTRASALAILARVLMARTRSDEAMAAAEQAMELLADIGGVEEGEAVIRLAFAEALDAAGATERAHRAIQDAREHLMARAAKIDEPEWRQSFLENVPENARTIALAERW